MITLAYKKDHRSIKNFETVQLPSFCVITGKNGSGKTHLLEAIKNGSIEVSGLNRNKIVYYSTDSFKASIENSAKPDDQYQKRETIKRSFFQYRKNQLSIQFNTIRSQGIDVKNSTELLAVFRLENEEIIEVTRTLLKESMNEVMVQQRIDYLVMTKKIFVKNLKQHIEKQLNIEVLCAKAGKNLLDLDETDFESLPIEEFNQSGELKLASQFSIWVAEYEYNKINRYYAKEENKDLNFLEDDDFYSIYGKEPWLAANEILELAQLPYKFDMPKGTIFDLKENFQLNLVDKTNGDVVSLSQLSSGEQNLLALLAFKYQSENEYGRLSLPKLFLFDEVDAHLHPAFTEVLMRILHEYFVKEGIHVILTTHSPSTVALAEKHSAKIYELTREDKQLKKITSSEASDILSAGFLSVLPNDKIVITESSDDASYYQSVHDYLVKKNKISNTRALKFVGANHGDDRSNGGGQTQVKKWAKAVSELVEKTEEIGDFGMDRFSWLLDQDTESENANQCCGSIVVINRSSLENYLCDPVALLIILIEGGASELLPTWGSRDCTAEEVLNVTPAELEALIGELEVLVEINSEDQTILEYPFLDVPVSVSLQWVNMDGHELSRLVRKSFNNNPIKSLGSGTLVDKKFSNIRILHTKKYVDIIPLCLIGTMETLKR